ncbi:MAG: metalloregulator ArsR/SmtB family transcription factor [Armatimonadetes bacterium]|nr:metalloregulator ArsR/SmtB family transcription factor [Armatimonadota bacterium]MDW8121523.1 metalloregulator ArsR/SmtB family transcription factor [Armatimonadota bacterium]
MLRGKPETPTECAEFLKALGDKTRLEILTLLMEKEWSVTDLANRLKLSQPHTSHHLAILRSVGVVETRRDGKKIFYRLSPLFREQATKGEELNLGCCTIRFHLPSRVSLMDLDENARQ